MISGISCSLLENLLITVYLKCLNLEIFFLCFTSVRFVKIICILTLWILNYLLLLSCNFNVKPKQFIAKFSAVCLLWSSKLERKNKTRSAKSRASYLNSSTFFFCICVFTRPLIFVANVIMRRGYTLESVLQFFVQDEKCSQCIAIM